MQSIRIWIILMISTAFGVSYIRAHEPEDAKDDSVPLPFQDQIEDVFDAFVKGDNDRMENTFKFLESIDPDEINKIGDADRTVDYRRERIDYVVSLKYKWKTSLPLKFHNQTVHFKPNQIKAAGYPVEKHQITTDDGYILHAFRIPYGRKSPQTNQTRPVVLIMHGLMDSSNGVIVLPPGESLGKKNLVYKYNTRRVQKLNNCISN